MKSFKPALEQKAILVTLAVAVTLVLVFIFAFISIKGFGDYGWLVFAYIPFILGFLPPYIIGRHKPLLLTDAYFYSFTTTFLAAFLLLVFALEGFICILMAAPIVLPIMFFSSYVAYRITKGSNHKPLPLTVFLLCVGLITTSFDSLSDGKQLTQVATHVTVNAPIEAVWDKVIAFPTIPEPEELMFRYGISYPIDAKIEGKGVGAIRYCNFSTGSFVEPITVWDEPNLLQFDVLAQPVPMKELNPFHEVQPPHLDGYFRSYHGEFKLTALADGATALVGTTWYAVDIHPRFYWNWWADAIIHRIHDRVLLHIKATCEAER